MTVADPPAQPSTAVTVPSLVESRADLDGLGDLVAVCRHPNSRIYAVIFWFYCLALGVYPLVLALGAAFVPTGPDAHRPAWWILLPVGLAGAGVTYFVGRQAIGNVTRRALYLYRRGYVETKATGRIRRVRRWPDVTAMRRAQDYRVQLTVPAEQAGGAYVIRRVYGSRRRVHYPQQLSREIVRPLDERLVTVLVELDIEDHQP
ncbi:hypothetical protein GCM10010168_72770 [Actinoplanes ianthinogenes]|uniref:Uncharacterized protein n=1 Tax=Actinoplanes ianthinogenes TaxID=122358 RepID=A0ABM7LN71_9ACTN|nr:hypothetical protein [Actinoplanes ianthinogenes]BCJ40735.1 hypothetical protein Aiant_13920 [Actinoplanes ianthinogenes]GGR43261.1 hypothetical protein GCM10010168_72770 [Actinoplanes ianthinogenes]